MVILKEERFLTHSANYYDLLYDHRWRSLDDMRINVSIDGNVANHVRYIDRCCV